MKSGIHKTLFAFLFVLGIAPLFLSSCSDINTVGDQHFDKAGYLIPDTASKDSFVLRQPSQLKFYVEVSGSMNGFFRANKPTAFKRDLWNVMSFYNAISPDVYVLTDNGDTGVKLHQSEFQKYMNTGAFISSASTKVPLMLESILSNLNAENGEVAVLVSDMKYSPVGSAAPEVLLSQYSTDLSKIISRYGKAVSLICAVSDYLDAQGNDVAAGRSPYYYFIMGNAEQVAEVRNEISSLLTNSRTFVDNIDSGFNFGKPSCSFGIPNKCEQLDDEPTFVNYEDEELGDTCTINLKVDLSKYRWIVSDSTVFRKAFSVKTLYGSQVSVGNIKIETENVTGKDKYLKRESIATVELRVSHLASDSDVLEWTLDLPDTNYSLFNEFFENATSEGDPTKSFSVLDFLKGVFGGGVVNTKLDSNYILISRNK